MSYVAKSEYYIDIPRGIYPNLSRFANGGNNSVLNISDGIADIWDGTARRKDLTTATQLYISSTNNTDNALVIVDGLDANFNPLTVLATLSGQTQVALSAVIWKVYDMAVIGTGQALGTLYVAESGTVSGGVPTDATKIQLVANAGYGFGAIARRTVPAGYTLLITTLKIMPITGKNITLYFAFQGVGQQLLINPAVFQLSGTPLDVHFNTAFALPEKTDLIFFASTTQNGASVSVLFEGVLSKN